MFPKRLFQRYEIRTKFTGFALVGVCPCRSPWSYSVGTGMGNKLFAAIRHGKLKPGMAGEYAKRIEIGALPILKKMDGFKDYRLIVGADDTVVAVSVFANKAAAEAATQTMMAWVKVNLTPLLVTPLEAVEGTVVVTA